MAKNTEQNSLSTNELARIQEIYSIFDKDCDGSIETREVLAAVRAVGQNPTEREIDDLVLQFDHQGSGMIDFENFLELLSRVSNDGNTPQEIEDAFRLFDKGGTGTLSAFELRNIVTQMGEHMGEEEADKLMAVADPRGQGEVNWKELMDVLLADEH